MQKHERGDRKEESDDSPEISDRGRDIRHSRPPFGDKWNESLLCFTVQTISLKTTTGIALVVCFVLFCFVWHNCTYVKSHWHLNVINSYVAGCFIASKKEEVMRGRTIYIEEVMRGRTIYIEEVMRGRTIYIEEVMRGRTIYIEEVMRGRTIYIEEVMRGRTIYIEEVMRGRTIYIEARN